MGLLRYGRWLDGGMLEERSHSLSGELFADRLPDGGIVAAKIGGEPDQRKGINDPFRRVEVAPLRSVAEIARVGVMKVVIPLAKTDEGDQPTIAAAVFLGVGLCPHHVTE